MVDLRAQFRGHRQPAAAAGRDLQPGVPRPQPSRCCPQGSKARPIAVSCQSGALTFSFLSRGRDRQLQFHAPGQRRQPDRAGGARLRRLVARRGRRRHLPVSTSKASASRTGSAPSPTRRRAAGKPLIVAKVGRSDAGRRAAASHTGALAQAGDDRRRDLPPPRHHPRRRPRPHARCRGRLRVLPAAARQPGRDHHRLGRQRGVDGRHPVGARARSCRCWRTTSSSADHGAAAVLRLGAKPDRRAPRRRSARSATRRSSRSCRKSKRIDTILLIGSLANEAHRRASAPKSWPRSSATTEQPILLSTYTTATPGAMARVRRGRHPLLHLDAELRPRDPCAGRLRPRSATRRRRADAGRRPPPRVRDEVGRALRSCRPGADRGRGEGAARPLRRAAAARSAGHERRRGRRRRPPRIGGAVALKVQSPDILHKTEAGAVRWASSAKRRCARATARCWRAPRRRTRTPRSTACWCRRWRRAGREMILGITRDPVFGPMLMVGLGGIHVEVLKDVAFAPVPLGGERALALLGELKGAALLDGVRGAPPADRAALAELIATLSRFAADHADADRRDRPQPGHRPPAGRGSDRRRRADRQTAMTPASRGDAA